MNDIPDRFDTDALTNWDILHWTAHQSVIRRVLNAFDVDSLGICQEFPVKNLKKTYVDMLLIELSSEK